MFRGLEAPINPAPPQERTRGMLLNAATRIDAGEIRIGAGVVWKPFGPISVQTDAIVTDDADDCLVEFEKTPEDDLPDNVAHHAFLMWKSLQCSTLSGWAQVLTGRIEANLDIFRSAAFANELEGADLNPTDASLASSAEVVGASADTLLNAIVALENHFASVQAGAQAIIHLTPGLLVRALAEGIIEFRDGQYRTATGNVVIGDPGHDGQTTPDDGGAPGAGNSWIYISGDIYYAESAVRPQIEDLGNGETDLTRNIDKPLRERVGLLTFDPGIVGAALVEDAVAAAGGGGGGDATAANQAALIAALGDADVNLEALEVLATALGANTDQLEALITSLTTAVGDLDVNQEAIEALLTTINSFFNTTVLNEGTAALANTEVIKGSAGTCYGMSGYADAAGFVTIHDKATAPANTDVPVLAIPVESGKAWSVDFGIRGRRFATGISLGFSSTGPTFTSGAGSHMTVDAQYV